MRIVTMHQEKVQLASTVYTIVVYDEVAPIAVIAVLTVLMNGE